MPATKKQPRTESRDQFPGNGNVGSRETADGKFVPIIRSVGAVITFISASCIECDTRIEALKWAETMLEQREEKVDRGDGDSIDEDDDF